MPNSIDIQVETQYIYEQSAPKDKRYAFAYTINISNHSSNAIRLMSRHWIITDANEKVQEVQGDGVVGKQPLIEPGESFNYTSGCLLETAHGTMEGSYQMLNKFGRLFDVNIPSFTLLYPGAVH